MRINTVKQALKEGKAQFGCNTSMLRSPEVPRILAAAGLQTRLHAYGTNIEGEWDRVFAAVKQCHEALHAAGVPRISTNMRFGTRTDREQHLGDKIRSVEEKLSS